MQWSLKAAVREDLRFSDVGLILLCGHWCHIASNVYLKQHRNCHYRNCMTRFGLYDTVQRQRWTRQFLKLNFI